VEDLIRRAAATIRGYPPVVALTGAGISEESGIPTFRGKGGIWSRYDPEEYATIDAFLENPAKVWKMLKELSQIIMEAQPNPGHKALAELEGMGHISAVITQNVDSLHQRAGSRQVIELHGNNRWLVCLKCNKRYQVSQSLIEEIPPHCQCGGVLRPDVVFFHESLPHDAYQQAVEKSKQCGCMLAIGTSVQIFPASLMPVLAKQNNAIIIEINPEGSHLTDEVTDIFIQGKSGEILPRIVEEIKRLSP